jgi:rod shape-determining protein MreD
VNRPVRMAAGRVALYAVALWVAVAVEGAWAWRVSWLGGTLDPVLLVVLAAALRYGPEAGAWAGLAGGLLQDLAGGGPLGLGAVAKLVVGYGAGTLARSVLLDSPLAPCAFAATATVTSRLVEAAVAAVVGEPVLVTAAALLVSVGYNMAVAPAVFAGLRRVEGRSVARGVPPARAR